MSDEEVASVFKVIQIVFESHKELFDAMCELDTLDVLDVLIHNVENIE